VRLVDFDTAVPYDRPDVSHLADRPVIAYMAPEVTDGRAADEGADLYSLGATIYEMADGRPPFAGSRAEIITARRAGPPPPLERQDLPAALRNLIFCLLSADRERRPAKAAEVLERLQGIRTAHADIERLIAGDETARLEFKASLREPVDRNAADKRPLGELRRALEFEVIKTLAAFLNTGGGTLIIGMKDDHTIVGIDVDYPSVKPRSRDGWRLTFGNLVNHQLGAEVMERINLQLEPWSDHTIALIRCEPRQEPTWIADELYVRSAASTEKLSTRHAISWWHQRWG
jgi:serine/threonine protein kinase